MTKKEVSVIIPTLNAEHMIENLIQSINNQTYPIKEIIIADSDSEDKTVEICSKYEKVRIINIERKNFDHGKTRDLCLRTCDSDYIVFMTQDAIPYDHEFIENIIRPLSDMNIAVSTGRQIPKDDASKMERYVREFNYPKHSIVRSKKDVGVMGIKTFFVSDVCAAYNKQIYIKLGGFEYPLKTNEDMFFAAKAINHDYKISYCADAIVKHSHNLSFKEQYKRNFIQGYEIEKHSELLGNISQNKEGIKLVRYVSRKLLQNGNIVSFFLFGLDCFARLLGNKMGKLSYKKCRLKEKR